MSQPNFNSQDFYENLGVQRSADENQIKKAYRKLSLKYHPDKNPNNKEEAEAIFKIISFAYGIVGDKEKRKMYDTYGRDYVINGGHSGGGGGGGQNHFNNANFQHFNMQSAEDIFRNFFGGRDPFADFFDDEDDFFGGGIGQMGFFGRKNGGGGGMGGSRKNRDPFGMGGFGMMGFDDDDFFGGGGFQSMNMMSSGGGGGFSSFQSSSFGMGGGGGGMGESISQQTVIENGQQKTITKKTTMDRNGNKQTEVIEEFQDPRTGEHIRNQYLQNGLTNGRSNGGGNMRSIKGTTNRRR